MPLLGFTASHRTAHEVQVLAGLGLGSGPFLRTHYAIHVERLFFAMFKRDHFGLGLVSFWAVLMLVTTISAGGKAGIV